MCRCLHLALQEAPDAVEVRVVVVPDHDLQPAYADLGIHGVQQRRVALGQAGHHIYGAAGRSGPAGTPLPSHPATTGPTLGQRGPVQEPIQKERCLEGPPLGDVDGAGRGGCLVQGFCSPQLEEGLHRPGQAGPLRQIRLGQRRARGVQPALKLQPCREVPSWGPHGAGKGPSSRPAQEMPDPEGVPERDCSRAQQPQARGSSERLGSAPAPATSSHWSGFCEGAQGGQA